MDSEGEDGCSGRGDGVEGAGYCQCRCGSLRLRGLAFIVGDGRDGGEEREEEEEEREEGGSGESVEAHLVSFISRNLARNLSVLFLLLLLLLLVALFLCRTKKRFAGFGHC